MQEPTGGHPGPLSRTRRGDGEPRPDPAWALFPHRNTPRSANRGRNVPGDPPQPPGSGSWPGQPPPPGSCRPGGLGGAGRGREGSGRGATCVSFRITQKKGLKPPRSELLLRQRLPRDLASASRWKITPSGLPPAPAAAPARRGHAWAARPAAPATRLPPRRDAGKCPAVSHPRNPHTHPHPMPHAGRARAPVPPGALQPGSA